MTISPDLFDLIHALDKAEKRYFKLYASLQKGGKNYQRLFDEVSKQERYDEDALKHKFKGESFTKQFHVAKNYLYNLILRSMRAYNENRTVEGKLSNLMMDASFLENKGLYSQAQKALKRGRKLAEDYELHYMLLEILSRQRSKSVEFSLKELEERSKTYFEQTWDLLELLKNETRYHELSDTFFITFRKHRLLRDEQKLKELSKLLDDKLLQDDARPKSLYGTYLFHFIHALYNMISGNVYEAHPHYKKAVEVLESNPSYIEENSYRYKIALANYLQNCHSLQLYDQFPEVLEKIRSVPSKSYDEEAEQFQNTYFLELLYLMNIGEFAQAVELVPAIDAGLLKYESKINKARQLAFHHNLTVLFFVMEDFDKALDRLQPILNESNVDPRQDIQAFSRIFQLLMHYELGNVDILDNMFNTTYRGLSRKGLINEYEEIVLRHMKKIPYIPIRKERLERLSQFKEELLVIRKKRDPLGIEELLLWIESKLTGARITTLLTEQIRASASSS